MHGHSPVHRLPAHVKLVGLIVFAVSVVAVPREAFWAHALAAALLVGVMILAEIPPTALARGLLIELPIVVFALLLPVVGRGPRIDLPGMSLSVEGLWGAWTVLAKATLGVGASLVLASTTAVPDLIRGLDRLRVPRVLTAILGLMIRYLDITAAELTRRSQAMASRGYQPRWIWQTGPMAKSIGSLFIRSFERGERVHQAMVARGFNGRMPAYGEVATRPAQWIAGLAVPLAMAILAVLAGTVLR